MIHLLSLFRKDVLHAAVIKTLRVGCNFSSVRKVLATESALNTVIQSLDSPTDATVECVLQMLVILCNKVPNGIRQTALALHHFAQISREPKYAILLSLLRDSRVRSLRESAMFLINELLGGVEDGGDVPVRIEKRKDFVRLGLLEVLEDIKARLVVWCGVVWCGL